MTAAGHSDWDAIVVGSGLGGLAAAAYLATNERRTLVLEQHDVAGGCSSAFRRDAFQFDIGVHYAGDCEPGGAIPTILDGIGADTIDWLPLDPDGFDTLVFPKLTFRVPRGWDAYRERLVAAFPDEEDEIHKCVATLSRLGHAVDPFAMPLTAVGVVKAGVRSPSLARWGMQSLESLFDSCDLGWGPRAVIAAQSGGYAVAPSRVSAAAHAGFLDHLLRSGTYYPRGGGQVLPATLVDVVERHGGAVRTSARVDEILVEDGRARGVRLADGETIAAPAVISNADPKRTFGGLVRPEHLSRSLLKRTAAQRMALPLLCVYLGVDVDLAESTPNTSYWSHRGLGQEAYYEACHAGEASEAFWAMITTSSRRDPTAHHIAPAGHSTIEMMTSTTADGPWDELADALVARATAILPEIDGHVVYRETTTPHDEQRRMLAGDGHGYGLELSLDQVGPLQRPGPTTRIAGLYLAGASTVWCHGISGTLLGGVGAAAAVLGRDLLQEIRAGRRYGDPAPAPIDGRDALARCQAS